VRYRILAVGRPSRGVFSAAVERYLGRLRAVSQGVELVEVREAKGAAGDARREAERAAVEPRLGGYRVVLDERGRAFTTRTLADRIEGLETGGTRLLTVVIGGSDGTSPALQEAADEVWSLSSLTLPHELATVVALEQLYRVETLRSGHPYHRD
jgi:23S rRNA (pseudouridine1915-N3)-methyltransferase